MRLKHALLCVLLLLGACRSSPPPEPPQSCRDELAKALEDPTADIETALKDFLRCADISTADIIGLLL